MTPHQQDTELWRALGALEASVKSLETQVQSLSAKVDRLLYALLGFATAVIAALIINQILG